MTDWNVIEQLCIASFHLQDEDVYEECCEIMESKFPKSVRVQRLLGLNLEAANDHEEAKIFYDNLLETNQSNSLLVKRKVALWKSRGEYEEALNELSGYLTSFPTDASGWVEMGETNLLLGRLQHAIFCYEELLLLTPNVPVIQTRLAELYYSSGNWEMARSMYCSSLNLQPSNNLRSLLGFQERKIFVNPFDILKILYWLFFVCVLRAEESLSKFIE